MTEKAAWRRHVPGAGPLGYLLVVLCGLLAISSAGLGTFVGFREVLVDLVTYVVIPWCGVVLLLSLMHVPRTSSPSWHVPGPVALMILAAWGAYLGARLAAASDADLAAGFACAAFVGIGLLAAVVPYRWAARRRRASRADVK